jgi:hypothetical protein
MKLLVLGGDANTRSLLSKLLLKSRHVLEWRNELGGHALDAAKYDMLLVGGTPKEYEGRLRLQQQLREIRNRSPEMNILVFSTFNVSETAEESHPPCHPCGVVKSRGGVWQFRCRLHELAVMETQTLLREAAKSATVEPITFEYQG